MRLLFLDALEWQDQLIAIYLYICKQYEANSWAFVQRFFSYEGTDTAHIPLVRAVMNNDLASAEVLVRHDATPGFSVWNNETALKKALELGYVPIVNWLLGIGASVHKRGNGDDGKACGGKSALGLRPENPCPYPGT